MYDYLILSLWSSVVQVGIEYIPTEEERRVFRECNQESFWYRCKSRSSRCAPINDTPGEITGVFVRSGALLCGQHGRHPGPRC